jgi:Zn finger protein HypA/HybF involved in hydrogenase expression
MTFLFLAIVVPLWPITLPIFLCLAVAAPFLFLGYHATGWCPACGQEFATRKRTGGIRCAGCGSGLAIRNGRVFKV